ncbi:MAG: DUF4190 domain-containing protein [Eubacteriales bacterium]|nr:DUF4190 domain-containing protein [Eubacteriales bacterium]
MKQCRYCGAELPDEAKACSNCGRILDENAEGDFEKAASEYIKKPEAEATAAIDVSADTESVKKPEAEETAGTDVSADTESDRKAESTANGAEESTENKTESSMSFAETMLAAAEKEAAEQKAAADEAAKNMASEQKTELPEEQTKGKGYWQYGEWHPLEDLNKQNPFIRETDETAEQNRGIFLSGQKERQNNSVNDTAWKLQNAKPGWDASNWNQNQQNPVANHTIQGTNAWNPSSQVPKKMNGFALASLLLGVSSIAFYAFIIPEVLAVVFGIVALNQIYRNPELYRGRTAAIIGIVAGAVFIGFTISVYAAVAEVMKDPQFMSYMQEYMDSLVK